MIDLPYCHFCSCVANRNWVEEGLNEVSPTLEVKNETHDDTPRDPHHSYVQYKHHNGTKRRGDHGQCVL